MSAPEPRQMSATNRDALAAMNAVQMSASAWLAKVHYEMTQPGLLWADLSLDEQAEAILAAHPWLLAARVVLLEGRE
jgi:hypothetical protein